MTNKKIATRYLFIDMAIKNMQLDLQHVENGPFKIKRPYIEVIERCISKGINERKHLKKLMYQNNIRIGLSHTNQGFTTYEVYCDGYKRERTIDNNVIKKNVESVMMELITH